MNQVQAIFDQACKCHQAGDLDQAKKLYLRAVEANPNIAEAWNNLGVIHKDAREFVVALGYLRRGTALQPNNPTFLVNLGLVQWHLKDYLGAKQNLEVAMTLNPMITPIAAHTLAHIYWIIGENPLLWMDRAIEMAPDQYAFKWDRALMQLSRGEFSEGWKGFENRLHNSSLQYVLKFTCPMWTGQDLAGKTLYIHSEQGLGDIIQFARFVRKLPPVGRVIFGVPRELRRLFEYSFRDLKIEFVNIAKLEETPVVADFHIPVCSLPLRLGITVDTFPAQAYLQAPQPGAKISLGKAKAVGIVWAGNPTHANDSERSSNLLDFMIALTSPMIQLYSLQVGPRAQDIAANNATGLIRETPLADMTDTANLIMQLDAVVTVDTGVAHLAGALGQQCHVLLPYHMADWRWLGPNWYASCVRHRQNSGEGWRPVLARVAAELVR